MGSMKTKRAAAVVTLAASLMIGGAAFASPASARPGPHPQRPAIWGYDPVGAVGDAYAAVVYALRDRNR